jgi:hypothetical protein
MYYLFIAHSNFSHLLSDLYWGTREGNTHGEHQLVDLLLYED